MSRRINTKPRKMHENSLKNLKPCKPGECRNPKGRPKKKTIVEILDELIAKQKLKDGTKGHDIIAKVWMAFLQKHWPAFQEYLDRRDGPVPDEVRQQLSGIDGAPIKGDFTFKLGDKKVTDEDA